MGCCTSKPALLPQEEAPTAPPRPQATTTTPTATATAATTTTTTTTTTQGIAVMGLQPHQLEAVMATESFKIEVVKVEDKVAAALRKKAEEETAAALRKEAEEATLRESLAQKKQLEEAAAASAAAAIAVASTTAAEKATAEAAVANTARAAEEAASAAATAASNTAKAAEEATAAIAKAKAAAASSKPRPLGKIPIDTFLSQRSLVQQPRSGDSSPASSFQDIKAAAASSSSTLKSASSSSSLSSSSVTSASAAAAAAAAAAAVSSGGSAAASSPSTRALRSYVPNATVRTAAGTGSCGQTNGGGTAASFFLPQSIVCTADGQRAFISDGRNSKIRVLALEYSSSVDASATTTAPTAVGSISACRVSTLLEGAEGKLSRPCGMALSLDEKTLFVADLATHCILAVDLTTQKSSILAGGGETQEESGNTNGFGASALFSKPTDLTVMRIEGGGSGGGGGDDGGGEVLFVCDEGNNCIRRVHVASRRVTTFAGSGRHVCEDGRGLQASFKGPFGITGTRATTTNTTTTTTTTANSSTSSSSGGSSAVKPMLYVSDHANVIRCVEADPTSAHVSSSEGGGPLVTTLVGNPKKKGFIDGVAEEARFTTPYGLCLLRDQTTLLVADFGSNALRWVDLQTRTVRTLAGTGDSGKKDGLSEMATFLRPMSIAAVGGGGVGGVGSFLVTDSANNIIRQVTVVQSTP